MVRATSLCSCSTSREITVVGFAHRCCSVASADELCRDPHVVSERSPSLRPLRLHPARRAICGSDLSVPLYCITDVRDMTLNARIFARSVMSCFSHPFGKVLLLGILEKFSSGRTAIDMMDGAAGPPKMRSRMPPMFKPSAKANRAASTPAPAHNTFLRRGCAAAAPEMRSGLLAQRPQVRQHVIGVLIAFLRDPSPWLWRRFGQAAAGMPERNAVTGSGSWWMMAWSTAASWLLANGSRPVSIS